MTLAEFLEARLAEDEMAAMAVEALGPWRVELGKKIPGYPQQICGRGMDGDVLWAETYDGPEDKTGLRRSPTTAEHIARHDPTRVLAEVAAKREIVRLFAEAAVLVSRSDEDAVHMAIHLTAEAACQCLAAVYSGHPDYDEAWRP